MSLERDLQSASQRGAIHMAASGSRSEVPSPGAPAPQESDTQTAPDAGPGHRLPKSKVGISLAIRDDMRRYRKGKRIAF